MGIFEILYTASAIVGAFSAIAALTPTPKDDEVVTELDKILKKVTDVVHLLALNVGGATPLKGTKGFLGK